MFWYALFVLGYAIAAIGAGVIMYRPVTTIMGSAPESQHHDSTEDEIWRDLLITTGLAALWPIVLPLYLASRAASHAVS